MRSQFEIWKWIPGYEGLYKVSNTGLVRSVDRYIKTGKSYGLHLLKGEFLKQKNSRGYLRVGLRNGDEQKFFSIHRLVAQVFLPNTDNLPEVNHKDENKANNWVTNLEWCTRQYNINYGTGIERCRKKRINGKCSKTVYQYSIDGQFIREWPSTREVERSLGYSSSCISRACLKGLAMYGFKWSYLPNAID